MVKVHLKSADLHDNGKEDDGIPRIRGLMGPLNTKIQRST